MLLFISSVEYRHINGGNTKLVAQFINIGTTPRPREGVL
jgi:hypothetical protein